MAGGHPNVRDCIKGYSFRKVRTSVLEKWTILQTRGLYDEWWREGMLKPETRNASLAKGRGPTDVKCLLKVHLMGFPLAFVAVSYIIIQKHHSKNSSLGEKNVYNQISSLKPSIFLDLEISNQESTSVWKMALCANIISLFHIPFHDSYQRGYLISSLETHWPHHHCPGSHSSCFVWGRGDFPNRGSTSPDAIMLPSAHDGCAFVWTRWVSNKTTTRF